MKAKKIMYFVGSLILAILAIWVYLVGRGTFFVEDDNAVTEPVITNPTPNTSTTTTTDTPREISYYPASASSSLRNITPAANSSIESPVTIKGEARGSWMFEATFPITIVDWDGVIIGEGSAMAKGDWMTNDFVPFEAKINFTKPIDKGPQSKRGSIIIRNGNASGLPERNASAEIPIIFK